MHIDEALAEADRRKGRKFRVTEILEQMEADGRGDEIDRVRELLADESATDYRVSIVLTHMGYEVGQWPVKTWRRRFLP